MRVTFEDLGRVVEGERGATILEVAEVHGILIETACGGFAACNTCRVRVVSGEVGPIDPAEEPFLDSPGQRLACCARLVADVVLRLDPGA